MTLKELYNVNEQVLQAMGETVPLLTCSPLPGVHTGGISQGGNGPDCLNSLFLSAFANNLAAWAEALMDCYNSYYNSIGGGLGTGTLQDATDIVVSNWQPTSNAEVLRVSPNSIDPRLVSVPRTQITPGLYEFRIHLKDGTILRHFEDVTYPVILTADFTNFVNINIYPVPVKEPIFAVDIDLETPMTIDMTVVNNMGVNFYTKSFAFDLAGRNKHVVRMSDPWPDGLYHAHFQFSNGSIQARSFIVDID